MKINHAKEKMLSGKPAIGIDLRYGSPMIAEDMSLLGYDYILIDVQHGNWTVESTMTAIRATLLGKSIPMVRVPCNDYAIIGRALDQGALGMIVPMVNTVEQAKEAVYATRYVPRGGRSIGPYGTKVYGDDYLEKSDDEIFLAVQIETGEAVENVEEILAVEGVDGCWIGPWDLGRSLGLDPGSSDGARRLKETILHILEACKKTNKVPGIYGSVETWLKKGFLFVTCEGDVDYLTAAARKDLDQLRKMVD